jgi:hypothetical protein
MSDTGFMEYDCNKVTYRFEELAGGLKDMEIGKRYYVAIQNDRDPSVPTCIYSVFADNMHMPDPFIIDMQRQMLEHCNYLVTVIHILDMGTDWVEFRNVRTDVVGQFKHNDGSIEDYRTFTEMH